MDEHAPTEGPAPRYDMIVVGSGAAGMTAAVVGRLKGLRVLVLEKDRVLGGTSAISGGGMWVPCSTVAERAGLADSKAAARQYVQEVTGNWFRPELTDAYLDAAPKMIAFLEANDAVRFFTNDDRPDYYPDLPGARIGGRCVFAAPFDGRALGKNVALLRPPSRETTFLGMMIKPGPDLHHFFNVLRSFRSAAFVARRLLRHARDLLFWGRSMDLGNGNALIAALAETAIRIGVDIRVDCEVAELVASGDAVTGVRIKDGAEIASRLGVVLAAGGFGHDSERRRKYFPHAPTGEEHLSPAPRTNTGDGIRMAESLGAGTPALSDAACWAPVSRVPFGRGAPGTFPHLIDRQKPGFVAVTPQGRRFVNESHSYHEFGRGLSAAMRGQERAFCFLIADSDTMRRYGIGYVRPWPMPFGRHIRSGYLRHGKTLAELARNAGIDADAFQQTIAEYNRHAEQGDDPAFHRGGSAYNRYLGDPLHKPNPCVAPILKPPFYAVRIEMGELGTFAGVETDIRARVLGPSGKPIEGLYAAGNDMSHIFGGSYVGGGSLLGPAMTFGYIAASDMAESIAAPRDKVS